MVELESNVARVRAQQDAAGHLCGDKLGLVSTEDGRRWPVGARFLLAIVLVLAIWVLVLSLPDLLNLFFGLLLDLLLDAAKLRPGR